MNIDREKIARKRSSLKQPMLFPSGMSYEEFIARNTKKLQWDTKVEVTGNNEESTTAKFKESQAHLPDLDMIDDVYQKRLHEVNSIVPTKEIMEQISKEENKGGNTTPRFNQPGKKRKSSIQNEYQLAKDLLKLKIASEEEMEVEMIDETMKNTLYNKCVGKLEEDEEDDDNDSDY